MGTNSIQLLYSDYRTATEYSPEYVLDFFSRNALQFNNITRFQDGDELHLYIELTWQYLNALFIKDRYNVTVDQSIKHLEIIDREMEHLNITSIKNDWYYGILFLKGMATYRLRDYKTSTLIFKRLIEVDPENDNYKNWLNSSRYGQRMWISRTITIICVALLLIEIFFKKYIPSFIARLSLDGIALTGFIVILFYDYYIKRSFRKASRKM
jgi:hypothetical protein